MKAVTIHVDEAIYDQFKAWARSRERTTSELIREAMERFHEAEKASKRSLADREEPASVGKIRVPWTGRQDMLDSYWDRT